MSIDPIHASTDGIERTTPEPRQHAVPTPRSADSGNISIVKSSKVETARPQSTPVPQLIPEHEVKVILDTPGNENTLVYQVLDKQSGDVVLQVPSAEHLRGIHESQELLQRINARGAAASADPAVATAATEEENNHGNKF